MKVCVCERVHMCLGGGGGEYGWDIMSMESIKTSKIEFYLPLCSAQ